LVTITHHELRDLVRENWNQALLNQGADLAAAIKLLSEASSRIVLVVNENKKLLGTITDGDVRRSILAGKDLMTSVREIMNSTPVTINRTQVGRKARDIMIARDLLHLPVINDSGEVIGLEALQDQLLTPARDNLVVIMAGGFGRRLYPLTRDVPKPLLPVRNKPILETIIEQLVENGFRRFCLCVHYHAEQFRSYFGDGAKWGIEIAYLDEDKPLGTAGALGLVDRASIQQPVLVLNADLLTRLDFGDLMRFHDTEKGLATMCVREYEFQIPFGVVSGENNDLQEIVEKPAQKVFVNAGIYVLEPEVLELCESGKALDMPTLLNQMVEMGRGVKMFPIHEYWLDIGRHEEYDEAQRYGI
jgi:dTDP-glucose pyrophosphorylase